MNRFEIATGKSFNGITVNGNYLIAEQLSISPTQTIKMDWFIQGGPHAAISEMQAKTVSGSMSIPLLVDSDGNIPQSILELLKHAENPTTALKIDTNYLLSDVIVTGFDGGTDNNKYLSLDCMTIKRLSISCGEKQTAKLDVEFDGMIDSRAVSDWVNIINVSNYLNQSNIYRILTWSDCFGGRLEADFNHATLFQIVIQNEIEQLIFLPSEETVKMEETDQISGLVRTTSDWSGSYKENVLNKINKNTFIHGGWMVEQNLEFNFGPLKTRIVTPTFDITSQPVNFNNIEREIKFHAQMFPTIVINYNNLFYINGIPI